MWIICFPISRCRMQRIFIIWILTCIIIISGGEDQSVNEKVLMSRIDQQIRVTEMVARSVDPEKGQKKISQAGILYDKKHFHYAVDFFRSSAPDPDGMRPEPSGKICGRKSGSTIKNFITGSGILLSAWSDISARQTERQADGRRLPVCKKNLSVSVNTEENRRNAIGCDLRFAFVDTPGLFAGLIRRGDPPEVHSCGSGAGSVSQRDIQHREKTSFHPSDRRV